MGRAHPNPMLVKLHHTYTLAEAGKALGICKATVADWIKAEGLPTIDKKRPILIKGAELRTFLQTRRAWVKQPLKAGQLYCLKCREPRQPLGEVADYRAISETAGRLEAICPVCERMMYRTTSRAKLDSAKGKLAVTFTSLLLHIKDSPTPYVKVNLEKDA